MYGFLIGSCSFERRHTQNVEMEGAGLHHHPLSICQSRLSPSLCLSFSIFHRPACPFPRSISSPRRHNAVAGCQSSGTGKCEVGERVREGGGRGGERVREREREGTVLQGEFSAPCWTRGCASTIWWLLIRASKAACGL